MKFISSLIANYRTTAPAIAALPAAVFAALALTGSSISAQFDVDPLTVPQWSLVALGWSAIWTSIGNLFSRAANVTSEESGIDVPAANRKIKTAKADH